MVINTPILNCYVYLKKDEIMSIRKWYVGDPPINDDDWNAATDEINGMDTAFEAKNANIQAHIGSPHAPSNAQKNSDIAKVEIEAKLTGDISSHGHPTYITQADAVIPNAAITAATKTKITYDAKGLVTTGANATTVDIADSADKRYCTDAQKTIIGNTSGANTGDQTAIPNSNLATMPTKTYKGRTAGTTGAPEDVVVATLKTDLVLVKGDVGLGNVDNTTDVGKPVSSATQTALDGKAATAHDQAATTITTGTLDGDRLPAISTTKKGGVPLTGTPTGKYLKDDGTWATVAGGSNTLLDGSFHTDTIVGTVARGDVITGQGATPKWTRLAKGIADQVLAMDATATDVIWKTPAGGGESENIVVATSDTQNATVNLVNAEGLTFSALANSTYIIEVFLLWDSSATSVGIKVSATASGTPTITAGRFASDSANGTPDSSSYNANDVTVTTSASPFTTYSLGMLYAVLKTAASASTWQLRFAAETTGTITIKIGSILRYRKVA